MSQAPAKKSSRKAQILALAAVGALSIGMSAAPAGATGTTTTSTDPATVLDKFKAGASKMDELAGMGAAMGMASAIFGAAALTFKRFVFA